MLAYNPLSNEAEWIPVQGMVSDLSQAEEASARGPSNMVPHDFDAGMRRLDGFGEQRSESGEEGTEESGTEDSISDDDGAGEGAKEAPHEAEETEDEPIDQGYDGDSDRNSNEESDSMDTTLDGSHFLTSSQGSMQSSHHYSLGCHMGVVAAGQTSACLRMEATQHL